ncbi:hypothetical protein PsYK624_113930 [Phanerochaete sordida]|uniref:Uncharacterized protein n=1 Tax=Phanerochaete sordida TaxID=48140 RepID=A0A9P3GGJ8_9APHY|nr:hypothetical protein PsYK624_113930 [Phanerochaete sordida]
MGLSPPRSPRNPFTAQGHAEVINAASKHNARLTKLMQARGERDGDTSSPAKREVAKDLRPRAKRKRPPVASSAPAPVAGPSAAPAAPEANSWYLDLDTWTWRREEPVPGAPSAGPRSDAGPSSAVPGASHPTGAAKRPRGRPRLPDELRKTHPAPAGARPRGRPPLPPHLRKNAPTGRPRGRPRKSVPGAELDGASASPEKGQAQPEKPKRPRGRPRKHPLPAPPPQPLPALPRTPPPAPMSLLDIQVPITPTLLRRAQGFPTTDDSEGSSMTLVQPAARAPLRQAAVPEEEEEGSDIARPAAPEEEEEGSDVVEYVGLDREAKIRSAHASEKSVELSAADFEPSPFVASPQEDASSVAKAPHEVLPWKPPPSTPMPALACDGQDRSSEALRPTAAHVFHPPTVQPSQASPPPPQRSSTPPAPVQPANQAVARLAPAQLSVVAQPPQPILPPTPASSSQAPDDLAARSLGRSPQVHPSEATLQLAQPSPLQQAVARAVSEIQANAAGPQSSIQQAGSSLDIEPVQQDQTPDEDEDVEMAVAAGDSTDDSAVPEYQSLLDLVHALAAYLQTHPHGRPGPFFIGSYAMLIDEKTRVGEAYARGVAGQVRETLKGRAGWAFRSRLQAMSASFARGQQSVELAYTCGCPYLLSKHFRACGGSMHVTVREVQGMPAAYAGVKGVRVLVRVEH